MNAAIGVDETVSGIAAAIGDPARARMLCSLLDGCARTSTELSVLAGVSASTASVHLSRLRAANLVQLFAQGKHRYYSLRSPDVAGVLEGLCVLAGPGSRFTAATPSRLRAARTCYDHIAGALGVAIHDRLHVTGWLTIGDYGYDLTSRGVEGLEALGIDVDHTRAMRRRFAFACLDWSERRPHLGGALGAALLTLLRKKKWVAGDLDSRALAITRIGRHELLVRLGLRI
jgi:DNA-binding transcriptional ArsR family regulator